MIDHLRNRLPSRVEELARLGRTLHRPRGDIVAYFDHRAFNGPTQTINGCL